MLQRCPHNDGRIVPESDDDGLEVMEVEDEEEDFVRGSRHHVDDNIEQPVDDKRVGRAAKRRGRKISSCK
jgi:hypothetical protein